MNPYIEINIEVPASVANPVTAVRWALRMVEQFEDVQVRSQETSYEGPEGNVVAHVIIAKFTRSWGSAIDRLERLAYIFEQDCLAVMFTEPDGTQRGDLYGTRRDKWLPFNPDYFIHF